MKLQAQPFLNRKPLIYKTRQAPFKIIKWDLSF